MRTKTLFLLLSMPLVLSCMKDETELFETSLIVEAEPIDSIQDFGEEDEPTYLSKAVKWIKNMQSSNGLLESAENTNFVSLYDNALAALVFMELDEIERAERIFDNFHARIASELLNGNGGFYQFRNADGENGNRTWMGDNAWLLIALNKYQSITNNNKYEVLANEIELWLRSLQDSDGGLWGGENEDGSIIPKVTEGIITAFNAVNGYDEFHQNILLFLKENRWDEADNILLAWPENPEYNHALDLHSLGSLVFESYSTQNLLLADRFYTTQVSTVNGTEISGYCFDEDKDVVWLEGTAQMALAYKMASDENKADAIISELEKSFVNSSFFTTSHGIPYASNHGTNYGQETLWDHADLTPALSATAWYIFAKYGFNPLSLGTHKEIPSNDNFWDGNQHIIP